MSYTHLFSPYTIRNLEIPNRVVMPPMSTQLGTPDGLVTPQQIAYYRARATGGTGMIIVEFCCVHRESGQSEPNQLALETELHIAGHKELVEAICDTGSIACLQLQHGGSAAKRSLLKVDVAWGASDVFSRKDASKLLTRAMTEAEIEKIINCFIRSAELGVSAGYQAVELHGAHGYLLTQFLSPLFNQRTDAWGGDEERRLQFPLRVIRGVRDVIGDRPLIFRLSADEFSSKGLSIEDMVRIAPQFVAAGVDALHVSAGLGSTSFDKVIEPMSVPEGWRLPYARRIREATNVPVIAVGQIKQPQMANDAIANGDADFIALGRSLLADPHWANKAKNRREGDIIPCTSCNFCVSNGFEERSIACADNPRTGRELDPLPSLLTQDKTAFIIGSGPAGLSAALLCVRAGFKTTLVEARTYMGGGLIASAAPPNKGFIDRFRHYLERQVISRPINLVMGQRADVAAIIHAKPDVVFIATGAMIAPSSVLVAEGVAVHQAYELLMGEGDALPPPQRGPILVYGGGETGCETAEYLLDRGYKVVLVTRSLRSEMARAAEMIYRGTLLSRLNQHPDLTVLERTELLRVDSGTVSLLPSGGVAYDLTASGVVLAQGRKQDEYFAAELRKADIPFFILGDARKVGRIGDAVRDAYDAVLNACKLA